MLHGSWKCRSFSAEKPSERFKYADEVQHFVLKIILYASEPLSSTATYDDVTSFFAFRVFKQSTAVGLTPTVCFDLKWRVGDWGMGGGATPLVSAAEPGPSYWRLSENRESHLETVTL